MLGHVSSGEYFGNKNSLAPTDRRSRRITLPRWLPRLSMPTMSLESSVGSSTFSTQSRKRSALVGPSIAHGASIRPIRKATRRVVVFYPGCRALMISRSSHGAQPSSGAKLVFVCVSSMKNGCGGSIMCRHRSNCARRRATSARSCWPATRDIVVRQVLFVHEIRHQTVIHFETPPRQLRNQASLREPVRPAAFR